MCCLLMNEYLPFATESEGDLLGLLVLVTGGR
jgi:hypothetical protein